MDNPTLFLRKLRLLGMNGFIWILLIPAQHEIRQF